MSKDQAQGAWDARNAFHAVTMAAYDDLGELVAAIVKEPNRDVAFFALDKIIAMPLAKEPGDIELVVNLKVAVSRLRASMAAIDEIPDKHRSVRWKLVKGSPDGRTFGNITCLSHHECLTSAIDALLSVPTPRSDGSNRNLLRQNVIEAVTDANLWQQLRKDLEHEHKLASLLPLPDAPDERQEPSAAPLLKKQKPVPRPDSIDATAVAWLKTALAAASDAAEPFIPKRRNIAKGVSKDLNYTIKVASLFGTKQAGDDRPDRYPDFMALWRKTQTASANARPRKQSGVAGRSSRKV